MGTADGTASLLSPPSARGRSWGSATARVLLLVLCLVMFAFALTDHSSRVLPSSAEVTKLNTSSADSNSTGVSSEGSLGTASTSSHHEEGELSQYSVESVEGSETTVPSWDKARVVRNPLDWHPVQMQVSLVREHPYLIKEVPHLDESRALQSIILPKCDLIRRTVIRKWLPMGRMGSDGVYRVHLAFMGDSHSRNLRHSISEELMVCVRGRFTLWEQNIENEVPFSTTTRKSVYEVNLDGVSDTPLNVSRAEIVSSYHKTPHSKNVLQTLANAYAPLFKHNASSVYAPLKKPSIRYDLTPVVRNGEANLMKPVPGTWLSPTLKLRAPDILYTSTGAWDAANPEPVWDDYSHYTHDMYVRPDFAAYFLHTADVLRKSLRANYTEPMQALFKAWRHAWTLEKFRSGKLTSLELAYAPPKHVIVGTSPQFWCEGGVFSWWPFSAKPTYTDTRFFLRGVERCSAIGAPLSAVAVDEVREAIRADMEFSVQHPGTVPSFRLIDWSSDEVPCNRPDGLHFDAKSPLCRTYLIDHVYPAFP